MSEESSPTDQAARDKEFTRLYFARQDIAFAQRCAEHLLKKGWHHYLTYRRGTVYFQQSVYTTALIVTYARPFTIGYGFDGLWKTISEKLQKPYSEAELKLHNYFQTLRNKMYAHTDSELHDLKLTMYPSSYKGFGEVDKDASRFRAHGGRVDTVPYHDGQGLD